MDRIDPRDVVRRARPLGFFARHADHSDAAVADHLTAAWRQASVEEALESAWELLTLDPARVWTLDLTGSGPGPTFGPAAALQAMAWVSGGAFRPSAIAQAAEPGGTLALRFELDGAALTVTGLLRPPLHFDLSLLERLDELVPALAFRVGRHADLHHVVVVRREQLPDLHALQLDLFGPDDFDDFRAWAREGE